MNPLSRHQTAPFETGIPCNGEVLQKLDHARTPESKVRAWSQVTSRPGRPQYNINICVALILAEQ